MSDGSFEVATALRDRGDGRSFDAELDPGWAIGDKPNGGYLVAVLARAGIAVSAHEHPLAVSTHFLHAPDPGPAVVEATLLRAGRSASQVRVTMTQDGRACAESLMTIATLTDEPAWWSALPAPALPPIEDCILIDRGAAGVMPHLMRQIHERLDPVTLAWAMGQPSGNAELRGYAELADGTRWTPLSVLVALDCYPPVTFDLGTSGWVPTLELTCYLRGLPAPGPLSLVQRGGVVQGARVDETCQIWDSRGRLVGSATQLAGVRVPDSPPAGA